MTLPLKRTLERVPGGTMLVSAGLVVTAVLTPLLTAWRAKKAAVAEMNAS